MTALCAREALRIGPSPRGLATRCTFQMRAVANNSHEAARVGTPGMLTQKNKCGFEEHLGQCDMGGVEILGGGVVEAGGIGSCLAKGNGVEEAVRDQVATAFEMCPLRRSECSFLFHCVLDQK